MALLFFAITLFISAFLLFLVQPIVGKMILPKLGGTPQVWNTCMVFFQTALLAGYFYTHAASTYLNARKQVILHGVLLVIPLLLLLPFGPFGFIASWTPLQAGNPIFATLWVLTIAVGVPFFVVATSAPLLQKWFAETGHPAAKDPYFLYGASNLGSMLALLLYPVLVEPFFGLGTSTGFNLGTQSWLWAVGYIALIVLVLGCGAMVFLAPRKVSLAGAAGRAAEDRPSSVSAPTLPEENFNPPAGVTPPGPEDPTNQPGGSSPDLTTTPPPPAPAPKPGPSTAIKKGSKQQRKQKKGGKQQRDFGARAETAIREPGKHVPAAVTAPAPSAAPSPLVRHQDEMTAGRRLRWILLAAVPSSLMLGVTTFMSEDISAIPLFWIIPLALYLLSFICVFMRWPVLWLGQPHKIMLYVQPVLLALVVLTRSQHDIHAVVRISIINLLAFFATALVCHGELARDRPSTRHLTEFYLLMSVGGMLGGIFNGLLAPILFPGVWEFPIALFLAGLVRPTMMPHGWVDYLLAGVFTEGGQRGGARGVRRSGPEPTPGLTLALDIVLPIAVGVLALITGGLFGTTNPEIGYGIPLVITCFFLTRPIRFGLALGIVLVLIDRGSAAAREDAYHYTIRRERSYFGILNVRRGVDSYYEGETPYPFPFNNLTHGTTDHGQNFLESTVDPHDKGKDHKRNLARVATTYYHRAGPAGMAMERFDWFFKQAEGKIESTERNPEAAKIIANNWNVYNSDARIAASMWGMGFMPTPGALAGPVSQGSFLVDAWSEPAYATIGLGTGTMASYARPFQTLHFYEIDSRVRRYSLPEEEMANGDRLESYKISKSKTAPENYFTYLRNARKRGAAVDILMGDARLRMAQPWIPKGMEDKKPWEIPWEKRGGPDGFYNLIVVDAFSSDAIPVHLLTKEAVEMYMRKLAPGGVLCVHVSNRHLRLVPVVADICGAARVPQYDPRGTDKDNKDAARYWGQYEKDENGNVVTTSLVCKRGRDNAPGTTSRDGLRRREHLGHTTSEWVMVARKPEDLAYLDQPADYNELRNLLNERRRQQGIMADSTPYWSDLTPGTRHVWTDDYSNLVAVIRWPWSKRVEE